MARYRVMIGRFDAVSMSEHFFAPKEEVAKIRSRARAAMQSGGPFHLDLENDETLEISGKTIMSVRISEVKE